MHRDVIEADLTADGVEILHAFIGVLDHRLESTSPVLGERRAHVLDDGFLLFPTQEVDDHTLRQDDSVEATLTYSLRSETDPRDKLDVRQLGLVEQALAVGAQLAGLLPARVTT